MEQLSWAGNFDIFFMNTLGTAILFGFGFFFVLIGCSDIFMHLRLANHRNWNFLKLGHVEFCFCVLLVSLLIITTLIRSNADPSVDMFNVDNPVSLSWLFKP
ncbi:MAG: hypothetical protein WKF59_01195 [Chitinophagaceae bacterium]